MVSCAFTEDVCLHCPKWRKSIEWSNFFYFVDFGWYSMHVSLIYVLVGQVILQLCCHPLVCAVEIDEHKEELEFGFKKTTEA